MKERLLAILPEGRAAYRAARPYPHIVIDGFLRDRVAAELEATSRAWTIGCGSTTCT